MCGGFRTQRRHFVDTVPTREDLETKLKNAANARAHVRDSSLVLHTLAFGLVSRCHRIAIALHCQSRIMMSNNNNNNGREEIVDKLHGALAAFRRERDDLFRKKELATERLRVVQEDKSALEKNIRAIQEKLTVLNKSVSDEGKHQLAKLQQEVEHLNKEVSRKNACTDGRSFAVRCHWSHTYVALALSLL